ncbi:AGC/AKT protein kinase [Thecamonas trahens ATCC 50062]|uniref:AGC/AKT protein kinase n=1 Tax=Thecamonas trahens ATCC 50062 TaxID=461836 RepID=A0A0L0D6M0_THETB|nr:AGC/AKT protein kinase [Thecamonas trahens ATCC 50062]KNC46953.1 AGC/AKT protein kinase [Thecamonas trahens ATCC 50062]|eukprot:XP_013760224.1 AGC/AKT protein kinase [Thecamonas trahens ATCC 50062]
MVFYAASATAEDNLVAVFSPEFRPETNTISMDSFEVLREIGHGSFGQVNLVRKKSNGKIYAMKLLDKQSILDTDAVAQSKAEQALQNIAGKHPLIVNLRFAFQTNKHLCIVLDYVGGGDLFDHLKVARRFDESRARLYAAEVYVGLEFMHSMNIVYRDLKMENVILDRDGHIRLADFGLAKELSNLHRTSTVCGTAEYMAPEVVDTSIEYGVEADWWSYGIFVFVMLFGKYPFSAKSRAELNAKVLTKSISFPASVPVSNEVKSLIRGLLHKNPAKRISGPVIRDHPWFAGIDWDRVANRGYDPPFKPTLDPEIEALLLAAPQPKYDADVLPPAVSVSLPNSSSRSGKSRSRRSGRSSRSRRRRRHHSSRSSSSSSTPPTPPSSSSSPAPTPAAPASTTSSGRRKRRRRRKQKSPSSSGSTSPPRTVSAAQSPSPAASKLSGSHSKSTPNVTGHESPTPSSSSGRSHRRRRRHRSSYRAKKESSSQSKPASAPAPAPPTSASASESDEYDVDDPRLPDRTAVAPLPPPPSPSAAAKAAAAIAPSPSSSSGHLSLNAFAAAASGDAESRNGRRRRKRRHKPLKPSTSTIDTNSIRDQAAVVPETSVFNPDISRPAPTPTAPDDDDDDEDTPLFSSDVGDVVASHSTIEFSDSDVYGAGYSYDASPSVVTAPLPGVTVTSATPGPDAPAGSGPPHPRAVANSTYSYYSGDDDDDDEPTFSISDEGTLAAPRPRTTVHPNFRPHPDDEYSSTDVFSSS